MNKIRVSTQQLGDRHFQVNLSARIAIVTQTLLRAGKGGRMARCKAAYFGFQTFAEAQSFARELRSRFPQCRMQVRQSERLSTPFEIKFCHEFAEQLAWEVARDVPTTSERVTRHLATYTARPSVRPDVPGMPRHTGRTMVVSRSGIAVGID